MRSYWRGWPSRLLVRGADRPVARGPDRARLPRPVPSDAWRIVYTLAVAVAAWGIAKLLGNVMILYGRRRFAVMVLLSFAIDLAVTSLGLLAYDRE